jgi:hypothetical protein
MDQAGLIHWWFVLACSIAWLPNALGIPAGILTILRDPIWRIPNIAVGRGPFSPAR